MGAAAAGAADHLLGACGCQYDVWQLVLGGQVPREARPTPWVALWSLPGALDTWIPPGTFVRDVWWLTVPCGIVGLVATASLFSAVGPCARAGRALFSRSARRCALACACATAVCALLHDVAVRLLPSRCLLAMWIELSAAAALAALLAGGAQPGAAKRFRAAFLCVCGAGAAAVLAAAAWEPAAAAEVGAVAPAREAAALLWAGALAGALMAVHWLGAALDTHLLEPIAEALWDAACALSSWAARHLGRACSALWGYAVKQCLGAALRCCELLLEWVLRPLCSGLHVACSCLVRALGAGCRKACGAAAWCWQHCLRPALAAVCQALSVVCDVVWQGLCAVGDAAWQALSAVGQVLAVVCRAVWQGLRAVGVAAWQALSAVGQVLAVVCRAVWQALSAVGQVLAAVGRALGTAASRAVGCVWTRVLAPIASAAESLARALWRLAAAGARLSWDRALLPIATFVSAAFVPFTSAAVAAVFCRQALAWRPAQGLWVAVARAGFALAAMALAAVSMLTLSEAVESVGTRWARHSRFVPSDVRFPSDASPRARAGYWLIQGASHARRMGDRVYVNLDLSFLKLVRLALDLLWKGLNALRTPLLDAWRCLKGIASDACAAVRKLFGSLLSALAFLARPLWRGLRAGFKQVWESPRFWLLLVAASMSMAYGAWSGLFDAPLGCLTAALGPPLAAARGWLLWLWSRAVAAGAAGAAAAAEAWASVWAMLAPGAARGGGAVVGVAFQMTSLASQPLLVVEDPTFAWIVFLQHLTLSRISLRLSGMSENGDFATLLPHCPSLWLGRAGFKQVFGPLFLLGSLQPVCPVFFIILQVLALPILLVYIATSAAICAWELRHSAQESAQLQELSSQLREEATGYRPLPGDPESAGAVPGPSWWSWMFSRGGGASAPQEARPAHQQARPADPDYDEIAGWLRTIAPRGETMFGDTCTICLEEKYEESGEASRVVLPCRHCFHERCVVLWFKTRPAHDRRCPMRCELTRAGRARRGFFL